MKIIYNLVVALAVCMLFGATAANAKTKKQAVDIYDLSIDDNIAMPQLEKQADEIISEAETVAQKRLAAADVEIDEKWAVIESRLLVMYESHKGLQELVESGIFTIPGKE